MQNGIVIKSADNIGIEQDLQLINQYTRKNLSAEDIYIFSVVLCDNDIDRDLERFDVNALKALSKLFVGKTGIMDHNPSAANQMARIFSCQVENVPGKKTKTGDDYYRLVGKAYLPNTSGNSDLIARIDSGIHKEISVGCAVDQVVCSVCGKDRKTQGCTHIKGNEYGGTICHNILKNPTDAYEWSFVAVPAQTQAGVIKSFNTKEVKKVKEIIKNFASDRDVKLTSYEAKQLSDYILKLEEDAHNGRIFRKQLADDVIRLSMVVQPEISKEIMSDLTDKMTIKQLQCFKEYFSSKTGECLPGKPMLYSEKSAANKFENKEFKI